MRTLLVFLAFFALQGAALAGDPAKGRELSEKGVGGPPCASCHGVAGDKPISPDNPILAGQYEDYLVRALLDYKAGRRVNPIMKAIADPLKKKDIEDLAAWFARQKSTLHFQR